MNNYRVLNNLGGWLVFLVAFITYFLTMEPTSSFWDCGEFIAASYKLQVGHPPGAPLYLMVGRIFSLFAGDDLSQVGYWINMVSVVSSALTITFLFWTITLIGRKLLAKVNESTNELTNTQNWSVLAAALIGSLAYTWSDTFWFSAVEAEVYATSSLFTAVVFWAMLRWDAEADQPHADRWLVFIAYLMGLSIGVHLLNLLTIPALAFIYYFRRYKTTKWGILATFIIGVFFLYFIQYGIIPGFVRASAVLENYFVNSFGLPVFAGMASFTIYVIASLTVGLFFTNKKNIPTWVYANLTFLAIFILTGKLILALIFVGIYFAIYSFYGKNSFKSFVISATGIVPGLIIWNGLLSKKENDKFGDSHNVHSTMNFVLMSVVVIILGFSSYAMTIIRSNANTPMDENNPADAYSLLAYLNREQYGSQPLFFGPYYNAQLDPKENYKDNGPVMALAYSIYDASGKRLTYFSDNLEAQEYLNTPEIKSKNYTLKTEYIEIDRKKEPNYVKNTTIFPRMWSGQDQRHVSGYKSWGNVTGNPDFVENMTFFFRYHVNHMYIRYLYWNFVGRQDDEQNATGTPLHGNWQSGIGFIDEIFTGAKASNLPSEAANNAGRNHYFFLPLILGLIGAVYQYRKSQRSFLIVAMLFFLTGLAIVIYLNQVPFQPRERDYAYAGSFYAFAIWIGLGVMAIYEFLANKLKKEGAMPLGIATMASLVAVPTLLVTQNWDDHNRQNRFTAPDFAYNYLNSTEKDAIIFTNGDNDTFPLWFLQEVENIRTDVRVVNLSLLNTDWYIDQMKRAAYDGKSVEFDMRQDQYRAGAREQIIMDRENPNFYTLDQHFDWILKDDGSNQMDLGGGAKLYYLRSNKFIIPVDSAKVAASGIVPKGYEGKIQNELRFTINRSYIMKSDLMILNLLKNFNWERPVYFAVTIGSDFMGLEDYFQLEGLAYRFVPYKTVAQKPDIGEVYASKMYENVMTKFKWGNMEKDDVYLDETNRNMIYNLRNNFARLANQFVKEKNNERAIEVLDHAANLMPNHKIPYNEYNIYMVDAYLEAGAYEKAQAMLQKMIENVEEEITYFNQYSGQRAKSISYEKERAMGKREVYNQLTQKLTYLQSMKTAPISTENAPEGLIPQN